MSDGVGLCEKDFELDTCNKQLSLRVGVDLSKSETRKNLFMVTEAWLNWIRHKRYPTRRQYSTFNVQTPTLNLMEKEINRIVPLSSQAWSKWCLCFNKTLPAVQNYKSVIGEKKEPQRNVNSLLTLPSIKLYEFVNVLIINSNHMAPSEFVGL